MPDSFNYPKTKRLLSPAAFQAVYASKQFGGNSLYSFNALGNQPESKTGITVAKKVSKKATDRNRIKRQIREFVRQHNHELKSAHVVLTAKPAALKASDEERWAALEDIWGRMHRWQTWHFHQQQKAATKQEEQ